MMSWVINHEKFVKHALLTVALVVFLLAVAAYLSTRVFDIVMLPERFVPDSLLAALTPAISVLLVYELLLLTTSVTGPFVVFIRRQFEIISLIVLRDLFKIMDGLAVTETPPPDLLIELAVVAIGSIILYFFVEVLERIEIRFVNGTLKKELPSDSH